MSRRCKNLVLDSGPLLSLSPLRGLAEIYLTVPQVLDELKDKRARDHFQQLALSTGVRVNIRNPDLVSLTRVIQFAKKTGDYAVLSHTDICVLALTHTLQLEEDALLEKQKKDLHPDYTRNEVTPLSATDDVQDVPATSYPGSEPTDPSQALSARTQAAEGNSIDDLNRATRDLSLESQPGTAGNEPHGPEARPAVPRGNSNAKSPPETPLYDDPSTDEDDGLGEWVTPDNAALHRSRALALLPPPGGGPMKRHRVADEETVLAGCMTADFAMQNVLLQMGLTLVGVEGKRVQKVRTWVLRCHACFKICKDNSKQFCPSCGNSTLMRASVTLSSPSATSDTPVMELHLKRNFQYKLRGTKYPIPAPRPGSAKTGPGEGLILREDQLEYMRAQKRADSKRQRDERRMIRGLVDGGDDVDITAGGWSDPDWKPRMLDGPTKGRAGGKDGMPLIGYGRRNPNEKKKH